MKLNIDFIYPIGSIYLSVSSTNPSILFGGTWEAFAAGRTLVGIDANQTEFNTIEKTGGSKYLQKHRHKGLYWLGENNFHISLNSGNDFEIGYKLNWQGSSDNNDVYTGEEGTGTSGNLQPYITVYMWKRIS